MWVFYLFAFWGWVGMCISQDLITKDYEWGEGVGREAQKSMFRDEPRSAILYDFPVEKSGGWK